MDGVGHMVHYTAKETIAETIESMASARQPTTIDQVPKTTTETAHSV